MKVIRHLPLAVLLLMLGAAAAALCVGWMLARVEREEMVVRDDGPLVQFTANFGDQITELEKNLDRTLLTLCRSLEPGMSDRSMSALAETYSGVRQISVATTGRPGRGFVLTQSLDLEEAFPVPRLGKKEKGGIDLESLKRPGVDYFWIGGVPNTSYFVAPQGGRSGRMILLGIDRTEIIETMTGWLGGWADRTKGPLVKGKWNHRLLSPDGGALSGFEPLDTRPDTVYPIASRMGSWQLQAWNQRRNIVEFQSSVFNTAAAIATSLTVVGLTAFFLLRRSVELAMQRVSFVNQVSHELRTPLTNMMLNLDLAKDSVSENGTASRRLGLVGEELSRLQRLLENVLTFSSRRKNQASRDLRKYELAPEIRRALVTMEPTMKRRNIFPHLDLADDLCVAIDRDALAQIFGNLFSNVLKYGGDGSELQVEAFSKNGRVIVRVIDSGPGVERMNRERIFRPFFRLSNRVDEGVSGSGLGLAIARNLAGAMNGFLICSDRKDGKTGACFELTLPRAEEELHIVPFDTKAS